MKTKKINKEILTEEQYQEKAKKFFDDKKNKTIKLYNAYTEYIEVLENSLDYEQDFMKKNSIKKEIKKLKREQKTFYVPTTLTHDMCTNSENRNYDPFIFEKTNQKLLIKK